MTSADVAVSLCALAGLVLLCSAARGLLSRALADTGSAAHAAELVSTLQLCCCAHELRLLAEAGRADPRLSLALTYLASVVHALTSAGAATNPCAALERAYRGRLAGRRALLAVACQLAAAAAARAAVLPALWGLGLSEMHARHGMRGFPCRSQIRAPLHAAAAAELAGAFAAQTAITHAHAVGERYRVHAIAAVVTASVYAGGALTGAVFNPALAFSTQFLCSGSSFLELCVVYWAGPLLGTTSSVLLFDKVVPMATGMFLARRRPPETKKAN